MTFTIEPMINAGQRHVRLLPDQWTVITKDHKLSAQWEHTLAVTESGYEVLTLRRGTKQSRKNWVDDGARTHDNWNHNPGLYQLSYAHQQTSIQAVPRKPTERH